MYRTLLLIVVLTISAFASPQQVDAIHTPPKTVTVADNKKNEQTVYITRTGAKYHRGSCRYLSRSKIAIKRGDAIAQGYEACKVCQP